MALTFGISVGNCPAYGLGQSVDKNENAEIAEARDCEGKVDTMKAYSVGRDATARFLTTGAVPAVGSVAVVGGITGLVSGITGSEQNTNFTAGSVTVRNADTATLDPYA
jgi:hypothetical protein